MTSHTWLFYFITVLILTASPGPSTLVCMTKSIGFGLRAGVVTALGSLTAITIIMTLSFTGLGVIVASSEIIFNIIKWFGAGYLVYLGLKALLSTQTTYEIGQSHTLSDSLAVSNKRHVRSSYKLYLNGFLVGASNPKAIVFFTALFPQFINPNANMLQQYLAFATTFVLLELFWLLTYAYMGAKSSKWIMKSGRATFFNRLTGGVFIGAGLLLSTSNRT